MSFLFIVNTEPVFERSCLIMTLSRAPNRLCLIERRGRFIAIEIAPLHKVLPFNDIPKQ